MNNVNKALNLDQTDKKQRKIITLLALFDMKKHTTFFVIIFNKNKLLLVLKTIWKVQVKFLYERNPFLIIMILVF